MTVLVIILMDMGLMHDIHNRVDMLGLVFSNIATIMVLLFAMKIVPDKQDTDLIKQQKAWVLSYVGNFFMIIAYIGMGFKISDGVALLIRKELSINGMFWLLFGITFLIVMGYDMTYKKQKNLVPLNRIRSQIIWIHIVPFLAGCASWLLVG